MQKKYNAKGVVLVALSYESTSLVEPYVAKHGIKYFVGGGAESSKNAYGVRGYPTMFVVDPDGRITWKGHSITDAEKAIKQVLKENPPKKVSSLGEQAAKSAYKKASKLYKKKKYSAAFDAYEKTAKKYKGTKYAKKAKAKLKKIKSNKKIMAKIRRAVTKKKCENWLQLARALAENGKREDAIEYYERIIKKYPDSKYAKRAREEMAEI